MEERKETELERKLKALNKKKYFLRNIYERHDSFLGMHSCTCSTCNECMDLIRKLDKQELKLIEEDGGL